jgi:hypothetical protein
MGKILCRDPQQTFMTYSCADQHRVKLASARTDRSIKTANADRAVRVLSLEKQTNSEVRSAEVKV